MELFSPEDTLELPSRAWRANYCIRCCRIAGWSFTLRRLGFEAKKRAIRRPKFVAKQGTSPVVIAVLALLTQTGHPIEVI